MSKELTKFVEVFGTKAPTYLEEYIIECIQQYNTMSWQAQREFVNEFYRGGIRITLSMDASTANVMSCKSS